MDKLESKPAVTISVNTFNSSKYVLETLESIKTQSWKSIILQISDDCSTDNTVALCREWIDRNKDHFVETRVLTIDHNTGISANVNRAWDACTTDYLKSIAGDDLLLPNCIEDNMAYVREHPDAILVFSKPIVFGAKEKVCKQYARERFDYSFFEMTPEQQFNRIKYASCLPASTSFVNIKKIRQVGLRHDERIPLLEDRPKWINAINKGLKFHFFDKETVKYRIHDGSLCNSNILSPKFYESTRLAFFYYVFQPLYSIKPDEAILEVVNMEMKQYEAYYACRKQRDLIYNNFFVKCFFKLVYYYRLLIKKV